MLSDDEGDGAEEEEEPGGRDTSPSSMSFSRLVCTSLVFTVPPPPPPVVLACAITQQTRQNKYTAKEKCHHAAITTVNYCVYVFFNWRAACSTPTHLLHLLQDCEPACRPHRCKQFQTQPASHRLQQPPPDSGPAPPRHLQRTLVVRKSQRS